MKLSLQHLKKTFQRSLLTVLILAVTPIMSNAQQVLSWEDCVRQTLGKNPELISAAEAVRQSQADKKITASTALPQISSSLSAQRSISERENNSFAYSVTGRQLLFDGFKNANAIKAAAANIQASEFNYAVISSNIRLDLREAYLDLIKAQELIDLTKTIFERRKQNLRLVRLRHEAGREHKGALLAAEADLANAEFEVEQAKRNLSLAQTRLIRTIGLREDMEVVASGDLTFDPSVYETPDFTALADNTPVLLVYAAQKDAARFNVGSKRGEFLPDVYLSSSAGKSNSFWPPEETAWSLGVSVTLPLFEGGSRLANLQKARSRLRQAEANMYSGRDSIIITLEETWKTFMDSVGTLEVQKKFLSAAEERAKIATAQYSSGLINFDDWVIIEDNLVTQKKSYLNSQTNVLTAEARWVQAQGGTLEYDRIE
jgi:outer membrane protein TolC